MESHQQEILPNSCRVCLKTGNKLSSLYKSDEDEETPCKMLNQITGILLEDENEHLKLPKQICRNCICELNLSYQFREKALKAQRIIEKCLAENLKAAEYKTLNNPTVDPASSPVKKQICKNQIVNTDDNEGFVEYLYEENDCFDCFPNYDSIDKSPPHELSKSESKKAPAQIRTSKRKILKNSNEKLTLRSTQINNIETNGKIKLLSKRGRKTKLKDETEDEIKCHICDICGNVYSQRGRLTEHRRRHETEAKYACELCDERFLLREALRRHMFTHLGGKPFKCNFCSRTFFYESVKKAHEAVHAGHKPYVCDVEYCKKAFAYSHALKKHKLIHSDTKLYRCNFCNKDFRLQHHMKQHEETKAHQTAVCKQQKELTNRK